jgi:hypothetical protein
VIPSNPTSPTATTCSFFGKAGEHLRGEGLVVRFLRVQGESAEVADPELGGAPGFEADEGVEVVEEGARVPPRLSEPEGGLEDRPDARERHRLVVVRRPGIHVDVRLEDAHRRPPAIGRA